MKKLQTRIVKVRPKFFKTQPDKKSLLELNQLFSIKTDYYFIWLHNLNVILIAHLSKPSDAAELNSTFV